MSKYTIGIDLGGTTMTAGLVNEKFEVVGKVTWATRLPRPAQDLEKALAELCRTVAREQGGLCGHPLCRHRHPGQRELHHRLCRLQHELRVL